MQPPKILLATAIFATLTACGGAKEALKDTLRLILFDCFQQLLKINQRFLSKKS